MASIANSQKVIADLSALAIQIIGLVKKGIGLNSIGTLLGMLSEFKQLAADAKAALPELKSLDATADIALANAAYMMVKEIVAAVDGSSVSAMVAAAESAVLEAPVV